ncbi:MAG: hypothetical protein RIF32_17525 [Leptospirales bacterium]|jgi:hypothetical protein
MPFTAVAPPAFHWIIVLIGVYLAIGFLTAVFLYARGNRGLGAFDPHAMNDVDGRPTIGFRVLIFPGMVALWPFVLGRRSRSVRDANISFLDRRKSEWRPFISRHHRLNVLLLLIFLPPFYALALLLGRGGVPPVDSSPGPVTLAGHSTGVPLARASVARNLENDFVPRLELELLVIREGDGKLWLHTASALDLLPPDTLLYWSPSTPEAAGDSTERGAKKEIAAAFLLGPLPPGPGRLALPPSTGADGRILGYSLAHRQVLFRVNLTSVTEQSDPSTPR